jgi:hypothetical protein
MYGIYANIGDILMVYVTIYGSTMDPMGYDFRTFTISGFGWYSDGLGRSIDGWTDEWIV